MRSPLRLRHEISQKTSTVSDLDRFLFSRWTRRKLFVFDRLIEAKFIGFSMYTTCVIWLAFAAVYFAIEVKVFSLCVATNASAYVVLIFLFFPKLYLIIFKPEKNHRR